MENTPDSNGVTVDAKQLVKNFMHDVYIFITAGMPSSKDNNNSKGVCHSIYTTQATVPAQIRMLATEGKTTAEGKKATSGKTATSGTLRKVFLFFYKHKQFSQ